jgi:hypothetical protein
MESQGRRLARRCVRASEGTSTCTTSDLVGITTSTRLSNGHMFVTPETADCLCLIERHRIHRM